MITFFKRLSGKNKLIFFAVSIFLIIVGNLLTKDNVSTRLQGDSDYAEITPTNYILLEDEVESDELERKKVLSEKTEEKTNLKQLGQEVKVVKVIDGDTVQVLLNGQTQTLRLIGINTPETVDPRKPVECFGREASNKAKEILDGKIVYLEFDPSQGTYDKYNRRLSYIFLADGTSFNKLMIREGFAYEYTYDNKYKYQEEFRSAQIEAEKNKKGLWADGACSGDVSEPVLKNSSSQTSSSQNSNNSSCGSKKYCGDMSGCEEAKFYLNSCGLDRLDADHDGVPCESICN